MKVFAHRVNDHKAKNQYGAYGAEIDVHISELGDVLVKHDPCGNQLPPVRAEALVEHSEYRKFFVDIKQNLDIRFLRQIVETFGDSLHALFDVPYPSAYFAHKDGLVIYDRLSEYERPNGLTNRFWLDPLRTQQAGIHQILIDLASTDSKFIIAGPELHGHDIYSDTCISLYEWIDERLYLGDERIEGVVTKFPDVIKLALNLY